MESFTKFFELIQLYVHPVTESHCRPEILASPKAQNASALAVTVSEIKTGSEGEIMINVTYSIGHWNHRLFVCAG
jgi:hypothetical protein